jgi:hypothetical protein
MATGFIFCKKSGGLGYGPLSLDYQPHFSSPAIKNKIKDLRGLSLY